MHPPISEPAVLEYLFGDQVETFLAHYPTRPYASAGRLDRFPPFFTELSIETLGERYQGDISLHASDSRPVTVSSPSPGGIEWLSERSDGMTFENIERVFTELGPWCDALRNVLALPPSQSSPRCNAFYSPRAKGYRHHFHYEAALLIQLTGHKSVRVAPVAAPFPVVQVDQNQVFDARFAVEVRPMGSYAQFVETGMPRPPGPNEGELFELAPGSVLFIPPGCWHATTSLSERSFAFSFFLAIPRAFEGFLRALELTMLTDPAWRVPVHPVADSAARTAWLQSMLTRLTQAAAALRPEDIQLCFGQTAELTDAATLCPNPDVDWSAEGPAFMVRSDQEYRFEVEAPVADVLRYLLRQERPFTLGEARRTFGADHDVVTAAIDLLLQLGCVVRGPFGLPHPAGSARGP